MAAHVTILFPFLPPSRLDDTTLSHVAALFAVAPAFEFRLADVRRFDDQVLYLAPEPSDPFSRLTSAVWERFDVPPYGGEIEEPVPHLTVADAGPATVLDAIEAQIRTGLPIAARADDVALLILGDDGRWRPQRRFPLHAP